MEYVTLANGVKMPQLGYGVYQVTKEECERCVADALKAGYRHIDTAQSYFNEEEVGNALKKSGIPREELFITTKVWIEHYGYEACRESVLESLRKLQLDYLDLVLLHQPFADYYGAWRALEELYAEGEPATFVCVGDSDGIADWRTMQRRVEALEAMGVPREFHVYEGLGHGFGLGTGTVAEGWFDLAVSFWERNG